MGTEYTSTKLFDELVFGTGFNFNLSNINQDIPQIFYKPNFNFLTKFGKAKGPKPND